MTQPTTPSEASRIRLTEPQTRALLWLPADGSWSGKLERGITRAVYSLGLYHPSLTEMRDGPFGPRGGHVIQTRLTIAGIAERRFREAEARGWTAPNQPRDAT